MLSKLRRVLAARFMAALAAATLAGAATGLPAASDPEEGHRCSCNERYGEAHECECVLCRAAALIARAADDRLPPCHRAAAKRELLESAPPGGRDAPTLACVCGDPPDPASTPAGLGQYVLAAGRAVADAERPAPRRPGEADPVTAGRLEPETPPPRST